MLAPSFHRGEAPLPPGRTAAPFWPANSANRLVPPYARRTGAAARYRFGAPPRTRPAGRIGLRHHSSLGLVTPATPTPHPQVARYKVGAENRLRCKPQWERFTSYIANSYHYW